MLLALLGRDFVMTPSAEARANTTFTVLYAFKGLEDGSFLYAGLVRDAAGNLYGTTTAGGTSGNGTVFKLDMTGTKTVLHSFTGPPLDGQYPGAVFGPGRGRQSLRHHFLRRRFLPWHGV
jgi:uncharacterized repeat protein (TIGR03803 family)